MKKISKFIIGPTVLAAGSLAGLTTLVSCHNDNDREDDAIYRLQFNNEDNLGDNTGGRSKLKDAKVVGKNMKVTGEHKDSHVLNFSGVRPNYLDLPVKALDNYDTTIAMWVKMPKCEDADSNRTLFGISTDKGYFYVSPFDKNTWNSFAIHSNLNGENKNLTKVPSSDKVFASEAPLEGTLQPIFDAWQLIGFSFTNQGLSVYQNGKQILSYSGNYSLKDQDIHSFRIGSAEEAEGSDFRGSISDVRVYNRVLSEEDYKNQFNTTYVDYNTINLDFNEGNFKDKARGYDAAIRPQAKDKVIFEDNPEIGPGRKVVHLASTREDTGDARSGFYLPKGSLMGHHELTISTDIYVKPRRDQDVRGQRIFDFASNNNSIGTHGERFMGFYYTMYDLNRCRIGTITDSDRFSGETCDNWTTDPNFTLPIDKWVNLTTVFTKDTTKLLLNGTVVMEGHNAPWTPSLFYDYDNCDFFVGRPNQGGSPALPCYIDNFKVWSTALTDSDIQDSMGNIHNPDDEQVVNEAMDNFSITECYRPGGSRIYPSCHLLDGVLATIKSNDENIIDKDGFLLFTNEPQTCSVTVTLSRHNVSITKDIDVIVPALKPGKKTVENNKFSDESYVDDTIANGGYLWDMQEKTFNWMVDLDDEKLLHMYKVTAGLATFDPAKSYGSWIRPGCGGEGQFQGEYIGALARATNYDQYNVDTEKHNITELRNKLSRLLNALEECQNVYATKASYGQGQAGYLNGFSHLAYVDVAQGRDDVQRSRYPELPLDDHIWVPWYMYHKQIMMCYDVMTYANMGNESATQAIRSKARDMFIKASRWAAKFVLSLTDRQREKTLRMEYGGMGEALFLAYREALNLNQIDDAKLFLKAARFFEETYFIEEAYYNSNVLSGIHVNTALPKFNSCCAAYEVLGDEFYLKATENEWQLIVDTMTMANGGISSIGEHFEEPGHSTQARFGEETCCSYNMLRVTDYLYRFTGDAKYMHYFEQAWYNHILPSIDMVGSKYAGWDNPYDGNPDSQKHYDNLEIGGKAYVMSTDFGHHITYSSSDDSFWCCVATGTESYTKLTYGNFYNGADGLTYVNMYNKIDADTPNGNLSISGINPGVSTERETEYVTISARDESVDLSKFRFIRPTWVSQDPVITINGSAEPVQYTVDKDYIVINDVSLSPTDTLKITLPMEITPVEQHGYVGTGDDDKYSYALYYGPYMIVPDLGKQRGETPQPGQKYTGDIYIHNGTGSDQSGQHNYAGSIEQKIVLHSGQSISDSISKYVIAPNVIENDDENEDAHAYLSGLEFKFGTQNDGVLTFRPFMDINYERYSFYMYYAVPFYPE